ncbi:MAG: phosphoenolpyruvate--protein phosphotransferase [Candidatus Sedimenticola endophacoides]|uniref:Phosphoenolpyruvate-protein phosphotransferase n=2 Tax=Candidatus Sedimenticola endophacoides TaxID=2548426 RepID=A0A6N4DRH1_9GAMM|nr:MAG: phosphoenolpyruvate--protein phosphotransferase [Candidatus Sedimenticola endophacoides]OQX35656.1 MAG: phosphoenolpyruvate--protein phosphotransferase [Candidatus Sedimenticola endophacoides]OQX40441.1 MAG: phosphoenolpyruvate--protein phosphotransferase [Candidatus Sedimenticola endophacoides]OQX47539.1 MAG: phosphoenolpyruvate--protein phosphotransferase [Candidatus Sedimenticola endophacoides]PUE01366.1 MAG: phosphoenolpyruvate--protein phosphotransferase [Candidatus Sedimenticola e
MSGGCQATGIGVSRGIAIGRAYRLQRKCFEISERLIEPDQVEQEVARFYHAITSAREKLRTILDKIPEGTRTDVAAFIDTHLLMLDDDPLSETPVEMIHHLHYAAEWALKLQRDALVQVFDEMEDPYLRTRKDDVDHVVNLIQQFLQNSEEEEEALESLRGRIILAKDLTPADTILFRHQGIAGFITEYGGPMSHTAILARSLGIPAVVGLHEAAECLRNGQMLILDGDSGTVIGNADEETLARYGKRISDGEARQQRLRKLIGKPATTRDGLRLRLMANIELTEDIANTRALGADGIGLYRTEFLYMNRAEAPREEEHFQAYRRAVQELAGIPITIRTLDLGADKQLEENPTREAAASNPALGLRAIRLCLKQPQLFIPQLRAILRAAVLGPVQIMLPMISNLDEVRQIKAMISQVERDLEREGVAFARGVPLGGMIEIPAAALAAPAFCRELDFLSIGTNDLVQYTLAIDRVDDEVSYLFNPLHPAVLRLIQMTIEAGRLSNTPVAMCGEMAGDPRYIPLLLGMGLREFSMQPNSLLEAKEILRRCDSVELSRAMERIRERIARGEAPDPLPQIHHSTI